MIIAIKTAHGSQFRIWALGTNHIVDCQPINPDTGKPWLRRKIIARTDGLSLATAAFAHAVQTGQTDRMD
jgi:hypothetical protein